MAVAEKVKSIIAEQLGVKIEEVKPEASFIDDLGADSLDIVELVMTMEEEFDLEIPDEDAEKIKSVNDVINYIKAKSSGHVADDRPYGPPYCDVDGDDNVVAEDALKIINYINANSGKPEAESPDSNVTPPTPPPSDLLSLLAQDISEAALRRRRAL